MRSTTVLLGIFLLWVGLGVAQAAPFKLYCEICWADESDSQMAAKSSDVDPTDEVGVVIRNLIMPQGDDCRRNVLETQKHLSPLTLMGVLSLGRRLAWKEGGAGVR